MVYPNPVVDQLIVGNIEKADRVQVLNITGAIIHEEKVYGNEKLIVNTSAWNSGIYVLRTISGTEVNTKRFIKE